MKGPRLRGGGGYLPYAMASESITTLHLYTVYRRLYILYNNIVLLFKRHVVIATEQYTHTLFHNTYYNL